MNPQPSIEDWGKPEDAPPRGLTGRPTPKPKEYLPGTEPKKYGAEAFPQKAIRQ